MIRYYCQYSYGGFKTFRIEGNAHEELTQVVSAENSYGFPPLADRYFNQGGVKLLYRYLDEKTISILIKEIPGHGLDTDNRPINCAIQFIGDIEDREILDRLTISIANNLQKFEKDFADMFDLRGGLHFDGDKLAAIVEQCKAPCNYEGDSKLLRIRGRKGSVLFFVPMSENFGSDVKVTSKVINELQLPEEVREEDRRMTMIELKKNQGFVKPIPKEEKKTEQKGDEESLTAKLKDLEDENSRLRSAAVEATSEINVTKESLSRWKKKVWTIGTIFCLFLFILVITKCYILAWIILLLTALFFGYKTYKLLKP